MEETKTTENCLITNEPLEENYIKLSCNHKFNYEAIFYEIIAQKKYNHLETHRVKKYEIKCPYCRNIQKGLIIWKPPYEKIHKVNWPSSKWYKSNICKFIYKKGQKKDAKCELKCYNQFCKKHSFKKCSAILASGKRKGEMCCAKSSNEFNSKYYCNRHFKKIQKNNTQND
tara:strand:+ start:266 stop:778 length:513 start_codon:yes stop_codon:yes gene_type:complete